jgi:hypothetical protein
MKAGGAGQRQIPEAGRWPLQVRPAPGRARLAAETLAWLRMSCPGRSDLPTYREILNHVRHVYTNYTEVLRHVRHVTVDWSRDPYRDVQTALNERIAAAYSGVPL